MSDHRPRWIVMWSKPDEWWPRGDNFYDDEHPDPLGAANLHVAQLAARGIQATVHRIDGSDE